MQHRGTPAAEIMQKNCIVCPLQSRGDPTHKMISGFSVVMTLYLYYPPSLSLLIEMSYLSSVSIKYQPMALTAIKWTSEGVDLSECLCF